MPFIQVTTWPDQPEEKWRERVEQVPKTLSGRQR
jgi:hypothetical protein